MVLTCVNCKKHLLRSKGRSKIIKTVADAKLYSIRLKKTILLDDSLCDNCRRLRPEHGPSTTQQSAFEEDDAVFSSTPEDVPSTSQHAGFQEDDVLFSSSYSESDNGENDPEFVYDEDDSMEFNIKRVAINHKSCTICKLVPPGMKVIPIEARVQVYKKAKIYIPVGNRCCSTHLIGSIFFEDEIQKLEVVSNCTTLRSAEVESFFKSISDVSGSLFDKIKDQTVSDSEIHHLTGLRWENIKVLERKLVSLKCKAHSNIQAIVVFLFKLRTAMSNNVTATVFGIRNHQQVSAMFIAVIEAFKKDVITSFGINHISRDVLLAQTSRTATQLLRLQGDQLVLIFDGTYVRHQKSTNNEYQRKSYSGQKKTHLCKPFTICTTNGFIADICGPYLGTKNDATIMNDVMLDQDFRNLLKEDDIFVVDRGFRDVVNKIEEGGFRVLMPALKGNKKQLDTTEANESRKVTKIRWVVEAVHGAIAQKYKLLHHNLDNKLLPRVGDICKVAGYLHNEFGKRLDSDGELSEEILLHMESRMQTPNTLCDEVEQK